MSAHKWKDIQRMSQKGVKMLDFITERSEVGTQPPSKDCNIKFLDQRHQERSMRAFDFLKDDVFSAEESSVVAEDTADHSAEASLSAGQGRGTAYLSDVSHHSNHAHPMAGGLSPHWAHWQVTPCCQVTKIPCGSYHPYTRVSSGSNMSLFYPDSPNFLSVTERANVIPVWVLVIYIQSELRVRPGIFHMLSPKAPTEPNFASMRSPDISKALNVAPVTPAATQEANVLQDNFNPSRQHFKYI